MKIIKQDFNGSKTIGQSLEEALIDMKKDDNEYYCSPAKNYIIIAVNKDDIYQVSWKGKNYSDLFGLTNLITREINLAINEGEEND